jgi:uncharacterized protein YndB with AHSA1/START domain
MSNTITVKQSIAAPLARVWTCWTSPEHIVNWNFATDDWHCPNAENNLTPGGRFLWRMEAKNGSMAFDYSGTYRKVEPMKLIELSLDDNRKVTITFSEKSEYTEVTEVFVPDDNDIELQQQGWQAILNNFKKYVESN